MKKLLLLTTLILSFTGLSQTVVWGEDFDNNGGAGNNWGVLDEAIGIQGDIPSEWWISDLEAGTAIGTCGTSGGGDKTLHVSTCTCYIGDVGAAYEIGAGLCGVIAGVCPIADKRSYSNSIVTTGVTGMTLSFQYMEGGEGLIDDATVIYSVDNGTTWLTLDNPAKTLLTCAPQGVWTAYSFPLPASCENITTLKIGFRWVNNDGGGVDPSFAVDDITITIPTVMSNTITTSTNILPASWCQGSTIPLQVDFTSTGTFNAGNIYSAELSDGTGSFAAPTVIGTLASTANTGTILAAVTGATPAGAGYRIRVVSDDPATIGSDNGVDLVINVPPTVTLAPFTNVCQNDPVFALSGGSPILGTYTGIGISGGVFNPGTVGPGMYNITYTYTDANGCSGQAFGSITVDNCTSITTTIIQPISAWCFGNITTLEVTFDAVGIYNAGNIFTAELSDASGSFATPTSIGTLASSVSGVQLMTVIVPGTIPVGNGYRIRVVASDPATIGSDNGTDLVIYPLPSVSSSTYIDVCLNGAPYLLTGGMPAGGSYTGIGVSGGNFDPSAAGVGTSNVTYTVVDTNGCSNSAVETITVLNAPTVQFDLAFTDLCITAGPYTFTEGTPAGGTYSGPGVTGGVFDPATAGIGVWTITYDYMDGNGCSGQSDAVLQVTPCTDLIENTGVSYSIYPNPAENNFTVVSEIEFEVIKLIDLNGRLVRTFNSNEQVDVSELSSGAYIIEIEYLNQRYSERIMIK